MTRLGLTLNEAKTSLRNARQERFDFLGYSLGPHRFKANGTWYLSASPLLANIYMNRFLKSWRLTGCQEAFRAHVVAYADDFVILSRGHAAEALAWTKAVMTKLGLTLNEAKTSVRNARQECFDFLGYGVLQRYIERVEYELKSVS